MSELNTIKPVLGKDIYFPDINPDGHILLIARLPTARGLGKSEPNTDPDQCTQGDGTRISNSKLAQGVVSALKRAGIRTDLLSIRPEKYQKTSLATCADEKYHVTICPGDDDVSMNFQHPGFEENVNLDTSDMSQIDVLTSIRSTLGANRYSLLIVLDLVQELTTDGLLGEIVSSNEMYNFSVLTYAHLHFNVKEYVSTENSPGYIAFPHRNGGVIHFHDTAMYEAFKSKAKRKCIDSALHAYEGDLFTVLTYGLAIGIPFPRVSKAITIVLQQRQMMSFDPIQLVKECGRVLYTQEAAMQLKRLLQRTKTSMVLTTGCFDVFHAGHADALDEAKLQADVLIIALNSDESVRRIKGSKRPICPLKYRLRVLLALESVDFVVVFNKEKPEWIVDILEPDVISKGPDYTMDRLRESFPRFKNKLHIAQDVFDSHTSDIIQNCML